MDFATTAGIISAVAACLTAFSLIIVSVGVVVPLARRAKKIEDISAATHHLVNQNTTDQNNYIRALTRALKASGIDVPVDQSEPDDKEK